VGARIFIRHSSNHDPFARSVRDAVAIELNGIGHLALLDRP
jgi:hypothetical protein